MTISGVILMVVFAFIFGAGMALMVLAPNVVGAIHAGVIALIGGIFAVLLAVELSELFGRVT